jgi:glycosyltransferase involved in cell wall biosynthesis
MFVDVVIPVYNPGGYLDEALKSCLSQSYKNFNIIVVDDCSTQNVKSITDRYDQVKYMRNSKNMGPGASRNIGIKNSSSELVSFLDSDDVWNQDKLLYSVNEFKKDKSIGMTCGNYQILVHGRLRPQFYKKSINVDHSLLMRNNYVASGSVTVRRDALNKVGLFNEEYMIAEDYDLWLRISEEYPIKYIHKVLYYYRIIPGGDSLTQRSDVQEGHAKNLNEIKKNSQERFVLKNGRSK